MCIVLIIISLISIPALLASFLLAQAALDQVITYLKRHHASSWESLGRPPAFFIPLPGALPARGLLHRISFATKLFFSTPDLLRLDDVQKPIASFRRYTFIAMLATFSIVFFSGLFCIAT